MKRRLALTLCVAAGFAVVTLIVKQWRPHPDSLPYIIDLYRQKPSLWKAFGGVWSSRGDSLVNRSDERGAKIVTGSPAWGDYEITAEMRLLGHGGEVGLLARVNDPDVGINAYRGVYAGIRVPDNALVLGTAENDWVETKPVRLREPIRSGVWYRMSVAVVGCDVAVELTELETGETTWNGMHHEGCAPTGQIGLRSLYSGAEWRNIQVQAATIENILQKSVHIGPLEEPVYPTREDDYSRMRLEWEKDYPTSSDRTSAQEIAKVSLLPIQPISSLMNTKRSATAHIRGVVTLLDPLYIQDQTAGIAVHLEKPGWLNLGDEVDLQGATVWSGNKVSFRASSSGILWDRSPIVPTSVTSTQAASAAFEGSIVEINGRLESINLDSDGRTELGLSDLSQHFRVVVPPEFLSRSRSYWDIGSIVQVRGVCSSPASDTMASYQFTVYAQRAADVQTIAGPSWFQGRRLAYLIVLGLLICILLVLLYVRIERWKLRTVSKEREKLAMDIHDTLAQTFAGVRFHLHGVRKQLRMSSHMPDEMVRDVDLVYEMTNRAHREASTRIASLHSGAETKGDVLTLLERSVSSMLSGKTIPVSLHRTGEPRQIGIDVQDALLRIGTEAVANTLRHGHASRLQLTLEYEPAAFRLIVQDDGCGFNPGDVRKGTGTESMLARAEEIHGRIVIDSVPGEGTRVEVEAPYRKNRMPGVRTLLRIARRSNRQTI